ncbi:MAG: DEAD/DEAH box helicase [Nanoarchaeota archaeon]|nr:DEAD/DEAH box helicase [Nanoarchaeota archaeon]
MDNFTKLGLKKEIIDRLSILGFRQPLEVQSKIIPLAMQGKNLVFTSKTGSGKTLAYSLGFLGKINNKLNIQMIIIVPTRELCIQVGKEMKKIWKPLNINVGVVYGGRNIAGDYKTTNKKNQIYVGTPGRLIQHINDKTIKVGDVKFLIYDESDQMFDEGFYSDCAYLKKRISKNAQIILSSATITNKVHEFVEREIENYEFLRVGKAVPKTIVQEKLFCRISEKNGLLLKFLSKKKFKRAIIFCNTKARTRSLSEFLNDNNFKTKPLNSDLEQIDRQNNLNLFRSGKVPILITTDVAARGLHIEDINLTINYDVPTKEEYYIHRIGRTGRDNKKGHALTLICPEDNDRFYNIEFNYEIKADLIDKDFKKVKHI